MPITSQRPWRLLNIPISPGVLAQVGFPHPFTREEWERFANILSVMEPGIVQDEAVEQSSTHDERAEGTS